MDNQVFIMIRKGPDGEACVTHKGPGAEVAGLAVNGVRHVADEYPEHAADMQALLDKDRRANQSIADVLLRVVLVILCVIGLVIVLTALGYGLHCMGRFALYWLDKLETSVGAWLAAL